MRSFLISRALLLPKPWSRESHPACNGFCCAGLLKENGVVLFLTLLACGTAKAVTKPHPQVPHPHFFNTSSDGDSIIALF